MKKILAPAISILLLSGVVIASEKDKNTDSSVVCDSKTEVRSGITVRVPEHRMRSLSIVPDMSAYDSFPCVKIDNSIDYKILSVEYDSSEIENSKENLGRNKRKNSQRTDSGKTDSVTVDPKN